MSWLSGDRLMSRGRRRRGPRKSSIWSVRRSLESVDVGDPLAGGVDQLPGVGLMGREEAAGAGERALKERESAGPSCGRGRGRRAAAAGAAGAATGAEARGAGAIGGRGGGRLGRRADVADQGLFQVHLGPGAVQSRDLGLVALLRTRRGRRRRPSGPGRPRRPGSHRAASRGPCSSRSPRRARRPRPRSIRRAAARPCPRAWAPRSPRLRTVITGEEGRAGSGRPWRR
jgi:hypothetical protein